jgi:Fe-S-cluster containining protein
MSDELDKLQRLKEEVLKDYPRMDVDSKFQFSCHPKVSCFNHCCGDVNIFLTPYDVMRMKNRLGISSTEFMNKFTAMPIDRNQRFPVILFRMKEEEGKPCPFVDQEKGCTIYEDRPWSCRMYPLGLASPKEDNARMEKEFYFLMKEDVCRGHEEEKEFTVREWLENQGIAEYDNKGKEFKELTLHDFFEQGNELSPQQMEMFFTACYDLDKFREFIFDTSFLERFHVEENTVEAIKNDDEALLSFSYRWLRYCLFGEPTLKVVDKTPRGKEAGKDKN